MPAFYAHRQFGEDVLATLPAPLQQRIRPFIEAFVLGTQGPDILFNHKPLSKNDVKQKGTDMHCSSAKPFFMRCHQLIQEGQGAIDAYVAGFICHFALDNACHPHIYQLEDTGIAHGRIESEFDKFVKAKYGKKIFQNATRDLTAKRGVAPAAAAVLEVDELSIKRAIKTMRQVNWCFSVKNNAFKRFAHFVLKKAKAEKFWYMFLHRDTLAETDELNPVLFAQYETAIVPTAKLIEQFFETTVSEQLFDAFDKDYKGVPLV